MSELMKKKYDEAKAFIELYEKAMSGGTAKATKKDAPANTATTESGLVDLSGVTEQNIHEVVGKQKLTEEQLRTLTARKLLNLAVRVYGVSGKDFCKTKDQSIETLLSIYNGTFEFVDAPEETKKAPKTSTAGGEVLEYKGEKNIMKLGKMARDRGIKEAVPGLTKVEYINMLLADDEKGGKAKTGNKTAAAKPGAGKMTKTQVEEAKKLWLQLRDDYGIKAEQKKSPEFYRKLIKEQEELAAQDNDTWGEDEPETEEDGWDL